MQTVIDNKEVLGAYINLDNNDKVKTLVSIKLFPSDLGGYWNRCGMTADFGANFMSYCYPNSIGAKNTLSFILNELVENAIKFSKHNEKPIELELMDFENQIIFEVRNFIDIDAYNSFKGFIQNYIVRQNVDEKYMELMTHLDTGSHTSQLGLLTIVNNFKTKAGFEFRGPVDGYYKSSVQIIINPLEI